MRVLSRHWPRMAVTLIPLLFALLHASEVMRIDVLQRLDAILAVKTSLEMVWALRQLNEKHKVRGLSQPVDFPPT